MTRNLGLLPPRTGYLHVTVVRGQDIGVFDYYKELIGFKQYGEPARLMKYIDPREAQYLDAAAGVHIRFRLGGFWKNMDTLTRKDNERPKEFRYSKLLRKQDAEKRRKRRKIEWLKKMYYGQSLQVNTQNPDAIILIQRAAEGLISSLDYEGVDKVLEWEVDEMLKWTNALNYDNYVKEWKIIGTSKVSEGYQGFQFTEQPCDISELSQIPQTIQEIVKSRGHTPAITLNR
ncbi:hypothetical protein JD844_033280 [Phrynosoma platyrhinos]|uniref:Uncharacterized protein n=1 Tax=Phrynosoma platyrhinos TaxID=52577 RepID=A0ABQ7T5W5_PHRPL|nr:hypothetical protein JD844_033280 [Phrynosoma platyrhinos]